MAWIIIFGFLFFVAVGVIGIVGGIREGVKAVRASSARNSS